jgi:large subunit ribosomal protein L9
MKQTLLLIEDVEDLGDSGDVVTVKSGYARNYLFPQRLAVLADKHTLRMQEKLKKERSVRAEKDKQESEALAKTLEAMTLSIRVKVDPEGKMYGSVSPFDVLHLLEKAGIKNLSKKAIQVKKHIKDLGVIDIPLKLKENVMTKVKLEILPEEGFVPREKIEAPSVEKEEIKTEEKPKEKKKSKAKEEAPKEEKVEKKAGKLKEKEEIKEEKKGKRKSEK